MVVSPRSSSIERPLSESGDLQRHAIVDVECDHDTPVQRPHEGAKSVGPPDLLALDFDGVLCDGMREYFEASRRTYMKIWPTDTVPGEDLFPAFRPLRPAI